MPIAKAAAKFGTDMNKPNSHQRKKDDGIVNFSSKQELIDFVYKQFGIVLENEEHFLNEEPDLLYTRIPKNMQNAILSAFKKWNIETNEHVNNGYWIYLINK